MRKSFATAVLVLGLAACAATAGFASGTDDNWTLVFRASSTSYTNAAGMLALGVRPGSWDGKDSQDTKYTANIGNQAQVVSYEPTFGDWPPYYNKDMRAPVSPNYFFSCQWDLLLWCGPSYSYDVARLAWWSTTNLVPPQDNWYLSWVNVQVVNDPTGTYRAGEGWSYASGGVGTSTSPVWYVDFHNVQTTLKMADVTAMQQGIKLRVWTYPEPLFRIVPQPVPECSALETLVCGLASIAAAQRRKRR